MRVRPAPIVRTLVLLAPLLLASALVRAQSAGGDSAAAPGDSTVAALVPADSAARADSTARADSLAHARAIPPRDYLAEARASYDRVSRAYNGARVVLRLCGPFYGILCGLLLLFTGVSARYRDIAENLGHRRYVRVLVYFALYSTTLFVLGLPLAWYEEFALEHQFGLSTQTFMGWLGDSLKGQAMTIVAVGVIPLLALAWRVIEGQPRRWWIWLAVGTLPVALAAVLVEPIVFDPLFNKFTPLEDAHLRHDILALAERAGIPARHVFQVDMSTRTRKLNAYVNGFGASQRVVIWDTTLQRMRHDEILYVTGHEIGHYVLRHIWQTLGALGLAAFALFWLCDLLVRAWLRAFGRKWGVRAPSDLAAMPIFAISLTLATMLATPAMNAFSRREEHEADLYGLELTHANDAAARAFLKLAQDNRSDPEPSAWVRLLLYDHPPLADRIRLALTYKPWERGEPDRFYRPR